jgi:nucleotide-binding universal stress UspA family protein
MIAEIAVHLTGSEEDEVRLRYAEHLAHLFGAHLTGLLVHALPDLVGYIEPNGSAIMQELIAQSYQQAEVASGRLTQRLAGVDLSRELRRLDVLPGGVGAALAAEARVADLFVATRPYGAPAGDVRIEEEVLLGSGRGCLFVPPGGKPPGTYQTILVAWNGSRESARAVAEALPLLQAAPNVIVAVVEEDAAAEQRRIDVGADIGRHLSRHRVSAEVRKIAGWSDAGQAILNEAALSGVDMIVMGGYGHSRFRELLLGGATRRVLTEATVPVLTAH